METEKENEIQDEGGSLRERAKESMVRRKKQVRTRIVLLNAAVAMLVIMCVFVVKLVSLHKTESVKENETAAKTEETVEEPEKEEPTEEPSATPAADIRTVLPERTSRKRQGSLRLQMLMTR